MASIPPSSLLSTDPPTQFSLGAVSFALDEAPDELALPATQNLAVKDRIGGSRVIQALGTVWKPIKWEGYLWGSNAQYRARLLSRMIAEGTTQRLTYLAYALDVVVEEFTPTWEHQFKARYAITVQVLNDVSGAVAYTSPQSVDEQIQSSLVSASTEIGNMDSGSSASVTPSYQAMSSSLDAAGPAAQATGPTAQAAGASITTAISAATSVLSAPPLTSTTTSLLHVTQYLNYLNVIRKNFATGQAPKTISLNGGSLFDVAAQFYGDPGLATALQTANGLTSTSLPSGVISNIVLPPLQSPIAT